ncbi:hypothetical protein DFH11DRAFT_1229701 [Phellopilus nigrolimitatus]|nr:hypothetical protein DFH11DRAFT_1229701 [Phellopilus nigrolimitatus]
MNFFLRVCALSLSACSMTKRTLVSGHLSSEPSLYCTCAGALCHASSPANDGELTIFCCYSHCSVLTYFRNCCLIIWPLELHCKMSASSSEHFSLPSTRKARYAVVDSTC